VQENAAATPRQTLESSLKQKSKSRQRLSCGALRTATPTQREKTNNSYSNDKKSYNPISSNSSLYRTNYIMGKSKLLTIILAVVLVASLAANVYLCTQTGNTNDATRVAMVDVLNNIQVQTDTELQRIGQSVTYASQQLTTTGLTGTQADAILIALAANSTFIIDAGAQDMNNIMVAVQPAEYSGTIGQNVGEQLWLNTNPKGDITPVMSPVIPMVEGFDGVAVAAPVFDSSKMQIGVVSVIFDPQVLLDASIKAVTTGTQYEFTVMQPNGVMLFDSHDTVQGLNFFDNADNTEILAVGNQIAKDSSGYGTYSIGDGQQKQSYWTTISAYSGEWRLIIHHAF